MTYSNHSFLKGFVDGTLGRKTRHASLRAYDFNQCSFIVEDKVNPTPLILMIKFRGYPRILVNDNRGATRIMRRANMGNYCREGDTNFDYFKTIQDISTSKVIVYDSVSKTALIEIGGVKYIFFRLASFDLVSNVEEFISHINLEYGQLFCAQIPYSIKTISEALTYLTADKLGVSLYTKDNWWVPAPEFVPPSISQEQVDIISNPPDLYRMGVTDPILYKGLTNGRGIIKGIGTELEPKEGVSLKETIEIHKKYKDKKDRYDLAMAAWLKLCTPDHYCPFRPLFLQSEYRYVEDKAYLKGTWNTIKNYEVTGVISFPEWYTTHSEKYNSIGRPILKNE